MEELSGVKRETISREEERETDKAEIDNGSEIGEKTYHHSVCVTFYWNK